MVTSPGLQQRRALSAESLHIQPPGTCVPVSAGLRYPLVPQLLSFAATNTTRGIVVSPGMNVAGSRGSLSPGCGGTRALTRQSCGPVCNWPCCGEVERGLSPTLQCHRTCAAWPAIRDLVGGSERSVPKLPPQVGSMLQEKLFRTLL